MLDINNLKLDKKTSSGLISDADNNFNKYIELYRKLLLLNEKNNLVTTLKNIQELLSFSEKIFSSSAVAEMFLYFCLHGSATALILQMELNMPEPTVYRALKRLRALRIIVPAIKVSKIHNSKGGPRPTIWALTSYSTDELSKALRLHLKYLSPKYRLAENVAQTILDEYLDKSKLLELSYREIVIHIKELSIPFNTPDIADLAAQYLQEKGMKVWR